MKTKQEYIEIITRICIEADESILDLVWGCFMTLLGVVVALIF